MEMIDKKKFAKTTLNKNFKAFVVYITSLSLRLISIHLIKEV